MFDYPVFLNLADVDVLVVGGGRIGLRKVAGLAGAGARVRLVAPEVDATFDRSLVVEHRRRPYRPADLDGVRLVITATGVPGVDDAVSAQATAAGLWVNAKVGALRGHHGRKASAARHGDELPRAIVERRRRREAYAQH